MSKIGKQPVTVPQGVEIAVANGTLTIKGPKGQLQKPFPNTLNLTVSQNEAVVEPQANDQLTRALYGTYRSHINNMVAGVTTGFTRKLLIVGIGYRANVQGDTLVLELGYSNPINMKIPDGITVETTKEDITFSGIDKESIGLFASKVRAHRKPEPYKGKGLRYDDEHVLRKAGKKTAE